MLAIHAGRIREIPGLVGQARTALARVMANASELAELWDEGANGSVWRGHVADLERRLVDIEAL